MNTHVTAQLSDGPLRLVNDPQMSSYQAAYVPELHVLIYGGTGHLNELTLHLGRDGSDVTRAASMNMDRAAAIASVAAICDAWVIHRLSEHELAELREELGIAEDAAKGPVPEITIVSGGVPNGPWMAGNETIKDIFGITLYRRVIPGVDDWQNFQKDPFRETISPPPRPSKQEEKPLSLWEKLRRRLS